MRIAIACLALTGCLSTTSTITLPAVPAPVTMVVDGDCSDARRTYPNATRCDSHSQITGAGLAVVIVPVLFIIAAELAFSV